MWLSLLSYITNNQSIVYFLFPLVRKQLVITSYNFPVKHFQCFWLCNYLCNLQDKLHYLCRLVMHFNLLFYYSIIGIVAELSLLFYFTVCFCEALTNEFPSLDIIISD